MRRRLFSSFSAWRMYLEQTLYGAGRFTLPHYPLLIFLTIPLNSFYTSIVFAAVAALFVWGFPQSQATAEEACRELIQNKCASCHFVKHICPKIEQGKGTLSWRGTVNAMVKEGLTATEQVQDRLVHCLAVPDEQVKSLCPPK